MEIKLSGYGGDIGMNGISTSDAGSEALTNAVSIPAINPIPHPWRTQSPPSPPVARSLAAATELALQAKPNSFASSKENVETFEQTLATSSRPLVHFPPCARGDMNAYKYSAFLEEKDRPLTLFEYFENPRPGSIQEADNRNIDSIKQQIHSLGSRLKEGYDYIFRTSSEVQKYNSTMGKERCKHYQKYDNIVSIPDVRKKVQNALKEKIATDPEVKTYLAKKMPGVDFSTENQRRESKLIVVNINKRAAQQKWMPFYYRHATPDDTIMRDLIDQIYDAQAAIGGKDKLDISFVGSRFNEQQQERWAQYGKSKGVSVHFFNDMVEHGLDRMQQRAAVFALADRYKSTVYLGHQSGVNEDAPILPRTNVYSLSEYLGKGQIGIGRVEARPQLYAVRTSGLGMTLGASSMGNFYSLRNSEFLTAEGILAAVQLKLHRAPKKCRPLNELWADLVKRDLANMTHAETSDMLLKMILIDAGKMAGKKGREVVSSDISEEDLNNYRSAVDVIVERMRSGESGLSQGAKQYFANAMKQELIPHDSDAPATRHEEKLISHNAGIQPYIARKVRSELRQPVGENGNFLKSIFPTD